MGGAMIVVIYFVVKILVWGGLAFSIFSIFSPHFMLKLLVRSIQWKLKWFGMEGEIRPATNAKKITRLWSVVMVVVFGVLVYVFTYVIFLGYALRK